MGVTGRRRAYAFPDGDPGETRTGDGRDIWRPPRQLAALERLRSPHSDETTPRRARPIGRLRRVPLPRLTSPFSSLDLSLLLAPLVPSILPVAASAGHRRVYRGTAVLSLSLDLYSIARRVLRMLLFHESCVS